MRGCLSGVHDKACVLFRYLSPADSIALEPRLVDERGGVAVFGTSERAARGGQVERLLIAAALVELAHLRGDGLAVALLEAEHGGEDDAAGSLLEKARAVSEGAVVMRHLVQALVGQVVDHDALDRVLQLAVVCASVHYHAAADAAGYAGSKLQAVLLRKARKLRKRHAGLGVDRVLAEHEQLAELRGADDEEVAQPLVGEKDVRPVADYVRGKLVFFEQEAYL